MWLIEAIDKHEGFASVILAVITALIAIFVPCFIAKRQNKIALFDKRFQKYQQFLALKEFSEIIKNIALENNQIEGHIWTIQESYLNIHIAGVDKEYIKNRKDITYIKIVALSNLERDKELFETLPLVLKIKDITVIKSVNESLQQFVKKLFEYPMDANKVLELGKIFIQEFSKTKFVEKEFVKELDLARKWRWDR